MLNFCFSVFFVSLLSLSISSESVACRTKGLAVCVREGACSGFNDKSSECKACLNSCVEGEDPDISKADPIPTVKAEKTRKPASAK